MKKQKIIIVEFDHDLIDPDILIAYTADGGRINLYPCVVPEKRRTHGTLYSDKRRLFFSLTRRGLHQIFDHFTPAMRISGCKCHNGERGNLYPTMRDYGNVACHLIILLSFRGPRPIGEDGKPFEGDHKNGCVTDYSNDNLEWVSKKENRRRSKVLKALRSIDVDPVQVPYNILDIFLNPKIISDMSVLTTRLTKLRDLLSPLFGGVFTPDDFRRWLTITEDEFDQMISKYHRDPGASSHRNGMKDCLDLAIRTAGAAGSVAPTRHGLRLEGDSTYDPIEAELSNPTAYHLAEFPNC